MGPDQQLECGMSVAQVPVITELPMPPPDTHTHIYTPSSPLQRRKHISALSPSKITVTSGQCLGTGAESAAPLGGGMISQEPRSLLLPSPKFQLPLRAASVVRMPQARPMLQGESLCIAVIVSTPHPPQQQLVMTDLCRVEMPLLQSP